MAALALPGRTSGDSLGFTELSLEPCHATALPGNYRNQLNLACTLGIDQTLLPQTLGVGVAQVWGGSTTACACVIPISEKTASLQPREKPITGQTSSVTAPGMSLALGIDAAAADLNAPTTTLLSDLPPDLLHRISVTDAVGSNTALQCSCRILRQGGLGARQHCGARAVACGKQVQRKGANDGRSLTNRDEGHNMVGAA